MTPGKSSVVEITKQASGKIHFISTILTGVTVGLVAGLTTSDAVTGLSALSIIVFDVSLSLLAARRKVVREALAYVQIGSGQREILPPSPGEICPTCGNLESNFFEMIEEEPEFTGDALSYDDAPTMPVGF